MQQHASTKATRIDRGSVRFTPRDLTLLRRIDEQYTLRFEALQNWMNRTASTVRYWLARMRKAGVIEYGTIVVGLGTFCWLTAEGRRTIGSSYARWQPAPATLEHLGWISLARLYYEEWHFLDGGVWVGEREMRYRQGQEHGRRIGQRGHLPDGAFWLSPERVVAIEVELHPKSLERTVGIMRSLLAAGYTEVHYFVGKAAATMVSRAAEQVRVDAADRRISIVPVEALLLDEEILVTRRIG